jgi:dehydrogenase/reductase SDR family member 1
MNLSNHVALVTGASRGVGRGIAAELAQQGAQVFVTGRSITSAQLQQNVTRIQCDHRHDNEVTSAIQQILARVDAVDLLVNNVWGGYERMMEGASFTWSKPFWEQPMWRWDAMFEAGVRAHYRVSQLIVPPMIARGRGLIVNISSFAARQYASNVAYGVSKAATDKMTADMAAELKPHGVCVVSLYPGLVRTEKVMEAAQFLDLSNSESPEFIGRAVGALASDPDVLKYSGKVLVAADLGREYLFTDIDGAQPRALVPTENP